MSDGPHRSSPHRLRRPLLLLVLAGALVLLAPQLLRPRIEAAAGAALGTPVRIGWVGITSLARGEVGVRGVAIGEDDALTVDQITVQPDLAALLDRRVVVERITLDGLDGTVEPDASGRPALRGLPLASGDPGAAGPAVSVQEIVLTAARVSLVPPRHLRRTAITLMLDELLLRQVPTTDQGPSWEGDLRGRLDGVPLTARARADRTADGTRIAAAADLTGAGIDSTRLVLPPGFESLAARASGRVTYELDPAQRRDRVTADLEISDLRLAGDAQTALAAERVQVEGLLVDLAAGAANLGHITVAKPRVDAALVDSALVYPGLVPKLVESGVGPPPDGRGARTGEGSVWRITGGRIDARDGRIVIRRDGHRVALDVPSFSWRDVASGRAGDLTLALGAADGGTIDVGGRLGIDPPAIDATVRLAGVELAPLAALAAPPLMLSRGTASGTIAASGDPAAPALDAALDVSQLHTAPPSAGESNRVLAVHRLEARFTLGAGASGDLHVSSLRLSYPYAMVARDAGGIFPLDVGPPAQASPSPQESMGTPAVAPSANATRSVRLDAVVIDGGRIDFVDHTTTPPYWMGIAELAGTLQGAGLAPPALAHVEVAARQDELHPLAASVQRTGDRRWQGSASLQGLSLATLNPYLSPVLGYEAQAGTLSAELSATLDGSRLAATTAVALDDVAVRQTGLDVIQRETGVPLGVALGLLKGVGGQIALDVPVEIDTTTGEYALGDFVTQALGRAVLGALSSPLRWLGMLFGTDGPPHALAIAPVPFAAGSGTLDDAGETRVGQIARILQSHAELDVILKAQIAQDDADAAGLVGVADLARRRVEAVRAAFANGRTGAPILASRLIVAEWTMPAPGALDPAPGVYVEVQSR